VYYIIVCVENGSKMVVRKGAHGNIYYYPQTPTISFILYTSIYIHYLSFILYTSIYIHYTYPLFYTPLYYTRPIYYILYPISYILYPISFILYTISVSVSLEYEYLSAVQAPAGNALTTSFIDSAGGLICIRVYKYMDLYVLVYIYIYEYMY
jgi:hypothetical protein